MEKKRLYSPLIIIILVISALTAQVFILSQSSNKWLRASSFLFTMGLFLFLEYKYRKKETKK